MPRPPSRYARGSARLTLTARPASLALAADPRAASRCAPSGARQAPGLRQATCSSAGEGSSSSRSRTAFSTAPWIAGWPNVTSPSWSSTPPIVTPSR